MHVVALRLGLSIFFNVAYTKKSRSLGQCRDVHVIIVYL